MTDDLVPIGLADLPPPWNRTSEADRRSAHTGGSPSTVAVLERVLIELPALLSAEPDDEDLPGGFGEYFGFTAKALENAMPVLDGISLARLTELLSEWTERAPDPAGAAKLGQRWLADIAWQLAHEAVEAASATQPGELAEVLRRHLGRLAPGLAACLLASLGPVRGGPLFALLESASADAGLDDRVREQARLMWSAARESSRQRTRWQCRPRLPPPIELFERYGAMVYRRCHELLAAEEPARDAVQAVFIKALEREVNCRGAASPSTWLYSLATLHCLQQPRNQARHQASVAQQASAHPGEGADPLGDRLTLSALLEGLDDEVCQLVVLRHVDGLTVEEVAELVGRARESVSKKLAAATTRAPPMTLGACPPSFVLERDLVGEPAPHQGHISSCEQCQGRLEQFRDVGETYRRSGQAAQLRGVLQRAVWAKAKRPWWRRIAWAVSTLATALLVI